MSAKSNRLKRRLDMQKYWIRSLEAMLSDLRTKHVQVCKERRELQAIVDERWPMEITERNGGKIIAFSVSMSELEIRHMRPEMWDVCARHYATKMASEIRAIGEGKAIGAAETPAPLRGAEG